MFKGEKQISVTKLTQPYALTVTLLPKARLYSAKQQYQTYAPIIEQQLRAKFPNCRLTLVAELTKTFDIHFHGIIQFDMLYLGKVVNIPRYFRDMFRRHSHIGFVLLKVITEDVIWIDYLKKSIDEFYSDLNEQSTICDDNRYLESV